MTSVVITPDGQTLVSASTDTTIKLWDLHAAREICTLTGHTSTITSIAISPDGQTLASGSADKTVKLWELKTARMLYSFDVDAGFVFAVCFHPNNSILASVHSGPGTARTINLWNLNTKTIYRAITTYEEIVCISISPDGQTLVGGSGNTPFLSITLWDLNTGKVIVTFPAPRGSDSHNGLVYSITFSPDGKFSASGSKDTEIKLWGIPDPIEIDDIYE